MHCRWWLKKIIRKMFLTDVSETFITIFRYNISINFQFKRNNMNFLEKYNFLWSQKYQMEKFQGNFSSSILEHLAFQYNFWMRSTTHILLFFARFSRNREHRRHGVRSIRIQSANPVWTGLEPSPREMFHSTRKGASPKSHGPYLVNRISRKSAIKLIRDLRMPLRRLSNIHK